MLTKNIFQVSKDNKIQKQQIRVRRRTDEQDLLSHRGAGRVAYDLVCRKISEGRRQGARKARRYMAGQIERRQNDNCWKEKARRARGYPTARYVLRGDKLELQGSIMRFV